MKPILAFIKKYLFLIVSVFMLINAITYHRLPYSYFQILRFVVCGTSAYFAFKVYEQNRKPWVWILGIIALIFNPILPLHFDKDFWQFLDLVTAVIFSVFIIIQTLKKQ